MVVALFVLISVFATACIVGGLWATVRGSKQPVDGEGDGETAPVKEQRAAFVAGVTLVFLDLLLVWTRAS